MLSFLKANFKIALTIILAVCLLYDTGIAKPKVLYKGVITAFQLNIRSQPSRTSGVVAIVRKGESIDVISQKGPVGSWLTIIYKGRKGYIRNREHYVKLYPVIHKETSVKKIPAKKTETKKKEPPKKALENEVPEKRVTDQKKALEPEKPVVKKEVVKTPTPQPDPPKAVTVEEKTDAIVTADPPKAKPETPPSSDVRKKESLEIQEKIETKEKEVQQFTQREREIIEGLNEIDYALNKARLRVKDLSMEIGSLELKIGDLNQDREALKASIDRNRIYSGQRLKALYKMNMIGRLDAAGAPTTIFDFFLQQNAMKRIISTDLNVLDQQNTDFEKLETLKVVMEREIQIKTALEIELTDQIRMNKKETLKRELILTDIRKKRRLTLAAVESLKDAQIRLDQKVDTLKQGTRSIKSPLSFGDYKGRLKLPVKGRIISKFGPSKTSDHKAFTFQKGIDIKVERGEPVKSVFKGEVMFARWLKGYGNLMIIDHGDNYYTLYAHVEEIFKEKGETVEKGEVIATAGDTGSIKGMCLHFEVRHHGKPVNPMQWFNKGA